MRRTLRLLLIPALLAAVLPVAGAVVAHSKKVTCPSVAPKPLKFGKVQYIDETRAGGEPVSIVAQDGSITVSAHAGTTHIYKDPNAIGGAGDFVVGYSNQTLNWRSADGGKTWKYVGVAGQEAGPHSPSSTGFSDPDLAIDAGGKLYNTEINLANDAVYSSPDDGQSWPVANPEAASGDRPWVTGQEAEEVYLYVNSPHQLWRSTDGGVTFLLVTTDFPAVSKLQNDPLNFDHGLIGPTADGGVAISEDDGVSWDSYPNPGLGKSTQFFGAIAVDRAGWVYSAAAGGYTGSGDTKPDGEVTFNYFNRVTRKWGTSAVKIPMPKGDAMWPWIIAGDDGRVSVVWYQTLGKDANKFYIFAAQTTNAHGSKVKCSDGKKHFIPPQWRVTNASKRPIHVGDICLAGTGCNANTDFSRGDRRLGDFFTVNYDHKGNLFIASGDTMLESPLDGPKPVSNPIFIKQTGGTKMLKKPDKIRETRCLFPQPSC
jgi:hypothetical protein